MSYWDNHSSLYATVQPQGVQELEVAIRFQIRGDYADALKSFELLDESVSKLPVTHIENAILYERMGLEQERLKVLNAVEVQSKEPRREPGADEWDLLNLLRANADLCANGKLESALSEACIIAAQVNQESNDDFSDLERCGSGVELGELQTQVLCNLTHKSAPRSDTQKSPEAEELRNYNSGLEFENFSFDSGVPPSAPWQAMQLTTKSPHHQPTPK